MTSAMPPADPDVQAVMDRYRTCEFATLSKSGVPIAWPTATLRQPDGTFLVTTSIALPQKAYNVRRDGRVAMLFSDPTASGLHGAPEVLVQGAATCPDQIVTDVRSNPDYWRRLHERQPFNKTYSANALTRRFFDWYYMRLLITVTPTAWTVRPPLPSRAPASAAGAPDGVAGDALAAARHLPQRRPRHDDAGRGAPAASHPRHRCHRRRPHPGRAPGRGPAPRPRESAGALPRRAAVVAAQPRRPRRAGGRPDVDLPARAAHRRQRPDHSAGDVPAAPGTAAHGAGLSGPPLAAAAADPVGRRAGAQGRGNGVSSGAGSAPAVVAVTLIVSNRA